MLLLYDEMKELKTIPNSFKIWYGFHSFYLAFSHISWAGVANIAFQFHSFRHRVKASELKAKSRTLLVVRLDSRRLTANRGVAGWCKGVGWGAISATAALSPVDLVEIL